MSVRGNAMDSATLGCLTLGQSLVPCQRSHLHVLYSASLGGVKAGRAPVSGHVPTSSPGKDWADYVDQIFLKFILFVNFREIGRKGEGASEICSSIYLCIHWWIPVCALTGDRTYNLSI